MCMLYRAWRCEAEGIVCSGKAMALPVYMFRNGKKGYMVETSLVNYLEGEGTARKGCGTVLLD